MHERVGQLLAHATSLRSAAILARAWRAAGQWQLELRTRSEDDTTLRRLAAATCDEVSQAAAVVIALALDASNPVGSASTLVESVADETKSPEPAVRRPVGSIQTIPLSVEKTRSRWSPRLAISVGGGVDFASLPRPAGVLVVSGAVLFDRLRLELREAFWSAQTSRAIGHPTAEASFHLATSVLAGCYLTRFQRLDLGGCGSLEIGNLRGEGKGIVNPRVAQRAWVGVATGPAVAWNVYDFVWVLAHFDMALALRRPVFRIDGVGDVHQPAVFSARASLFAELRFL